jgi:hypothetical protein
MMGLHDHTHHPIRSYRQAAQCTQLLLVELDASVEIMFHLFSTKREMLRTANCGAKMARRMFTSTRNSTSRCVIHIG